MTSDSGTPDDLLYTSTHEWLRPDGDGRDTATVGITDFAQDQLGDVVYLDLPAAGTPVGAGESCGEIESTKTVAELYAPVGGEVIAANGELVDSPRTRQRVALRRGLADPRAPRRRRRTGAPARRRRLPGATRRVLSIVDSPGGSPHPYIPATATDRARMLERVGAAGIDALFADLPAAMVDPAIRLPAALTEPELVALLTERAAVNADPARPDFLGAGAYRHAIPAITSHLTARSEFVTAYTPYQPEISQGTLQTAFEYQSVVCELTGMDVSNTGLYDGASATAEACLLAARVTKRSAVALREPIHPGTADVVRTYAHGAGLRVDVLRPGDAATPEHACLVVQQPDFLGAIVDLEPLAEAAARRRARSWWAVADPFALGLLRAPGDAGRRHRHRRGPRPGGAAALRRAVGRPVRSPLGVPAPDARPHRRAHARAAPPGAGQRRAAHRLRAHAAGPRAVHPARAGHVERLDGPGADRARLHDHPAGARPARPARGRRTVLPAGPRRGAAHRRPRRLRDARARALVLGVPRARPAAGGGAGRRAEGTGHRSRSRRVGEARARGPRGPAPRRHRGHAGGATWTR